MKVPASALWARARASLHAPYAPLALGLLAFVLSLPSLRLGLQLDDHTYLRLFDQGRSPLELLHETGSRVQAEKALGVFAWWSGPHFSVYFLRPLTAYSHWLEWRLWPDAAWAMHLSNCALYALLVASAALAYRAILPSSATAGLAALMFAVDESHAQSVGWITSRHTIFSTLFALLALVCHVRSRKTGRALLRAASVLCTLLTPLTAEFGVGALAYLVAYALVFERGAWLSRLVTIWPQALVALTWCALYLGCGAGVSDASWYGDPRTAPFATLFDGLADLPVWLLSQLGGDTANLLLVLTQPVARVIGVLLLVPVLMLLVPVLPHSQTARFCATGMLLSLLPLFGTVPQDRLLLAASFGGFGWIGCALGLETELSEKLRAWLQVLKVPHLIVAPLAFVPLLGGLSAIDATAQALAKSVPNAAQQVIVVNVPLELLSNAAWSARSKPEIPLHQLYAGFSDLTVERPDANSLVVSVERGWGTRPLERMFCARTSLPWLNDERSVPGMQIKVLAVTDSGLPSRVRFTFPDALEARGRVWLAWQGSRPIAWQPPAVGAKLDLAAPSMLGLLL